MTSSRPIALLVALLAAWVGLMAQSPVPTPTVPPPPVLTPFDPTPMLVVLGQQSSWTPWAQKSIVDTGARLDALRAQFAALPAVNLPTATTFQVPACRFSGIYGNIAQVTEPSRDTDGGCGVGWIQPSEHLLYTFYVPVAGNYAVSARVASPLATGAFHVEIDGLPVTPSVSVPNTAGWYIWQTVAVQPFMLPAGIVTISVVVEAGAQNNLFNLHWMTLTRQ